MDMEPQLCRLCLIPVDPDTVVILNQAVDLIDSILQITTVDVIVDSSRQVFICDQCQNSLDVSIQFRTMCLQNDATFRKMYAKQSLPLDGTRDEFDHFEAEFIPCKVEDTCQNNEPLNNFEPEVSLSGDNFQNDGQQSSSEEEGLKNAFDTFESMFELKEGRESPPVKEKKKRYRKKPKTDSSIEHTDGQHSKKPSSNEETKKRRKRIRPYKPSSSSEPRVKVQCQICGGFFSREHLSKHLLTHNPDSRPMYACELCPKKYPHKKNLKEHVEIVHENTKEHVCPVCGKGFARKKRMDAHFKAIHTEVKRYACSACDEKFPTSGYRNYHYKVHHTNLRPYSCQYCHMTFKRSNDLTLHTRTHTGEKPFKCDLCDKRFAKSYNVVIHKKSHKNAELRRIAAEQKAESAGPNLSLGLL
nr:zinc finger protein 184-like [Aedes albopictus]